MTHASEQYAIETLPPAERAFLSGFMDVLACVEGKTWSTGGFTVDTLLLYDCAVFAQAPKLEIFGRPAFRPDGVTAYIMALELLSGRPSEYVAAALVTYRKTMKPTAADWKRIWNGE